MDIASDIILTESEIERYGTTLDKVKQDLTLPNPQWEGISRFGKSKWALSKIPKYICYLKQQGDRYILPRYYFGTDIHVGIGTDYRVNGMSMSDTTMLVPPRDYQQKFFDENSGIYSDEGVLLEAACGSGKTYCAIYLACMKAERTLVLVPTYYLAKQWGQRISDFTKCTWQIVTSKDKKIRTDTDFTIVVLDLFSVRVLPSELVDNIGTVVLDEAHRVGAETYLPILNEIPARNRIALTATFRRADGVHKILRYHFGNHYKMKNRFPRPLVYGIDTKVSFERLTTKNKPYERALQFLEESGVPYKETRGAIAFPNAYAGRNVETIFTEYSLTHKLSKVWTKEVQAFLKCGSEIQYTAVDTYLNEDCRRMKVVLSTIRKCLDAGRTVLFLSKRKDTLKMLYNYFSEYRPMLIVSETNTRSDEDEEYLQKKCRLVLGVIQLAKEGLDIDRLDTLIIHLPMKDTEQAVGRVSRLYKGKQHPLCLYFVDNTPITWAVFKNAKKFFSINAEFRQVIRLSGLPKVLKEHKYFGYEHSDA